MTRDLPAVPVARRRRPRARLQRARSRASASSSGSGLPRRSAPPRKRPQRRQRPRRQPLAPPRKRPQLMRRLRRPPSAPASRQRRKPHAFRRSRASECTSNPSSSRASSPLPTEARSRSSRASRRSWARTDRENRTSRMPCCGCSASATPSICADRPWKTSSSPAPPPDARRGLQKSTWCSTTPTARFPSTTTRSRLRAACTVRAKANTSSTARWRVAWTCSTFFTTRDLGRARTRSSRRVASTPYCNRSLKTAARSSKRPRERSSTSSARRKASASWPRWISISRACAT